MNGKRGKFGKYMQVQKQFDDIEYWVHLQERLNHLAHCVHSVHMVTSVAFGDLSRLTHTMFFSKLSKTAIEIRITNELETTYCKCATLYGKTRVKYIMEQVPLCENTVFSRTIYKRAHFYRVFPCKMRVSRNCKNTRVLPCKSRHWAQK